MRLLTDALGRGLVRFLTHFVLKVPCDPLENIRKPLVFWCFQGYQRGAFGRNGLILLDLLETSHKCTGKEFDLVFNPFRPEALLWSPWKHQETFGFQMFSGGSKGSLGTSQKCTGKEFLHVSVEFQSFVGLFIEHLSLLEEIFYRNGDFIETFLRFFLNF